MFCSSCGREQETTNNLPSYPWTVVSFTLDVAGTASSPGVVGDTQLIDVFCRSILVSKSSPTAGDVVAQLGEGAPEIRLPLGGGVIKTSGFRKLRVRNTSASARLIELFLTEDPNFELLGVGRSTY